MIDAAIGFWIGIAVATAVAYFIAHPATWADVRTRVRALFHKGPPTP